MNRGLEHVIYDERLREAVFVLLEEKTRRGI